MEEAVLRERITFALLAVCAAVLLMFPLVAHVKDPSSWSDFMGFYAAARLFRQDASQLYNPDLQTSYQRNIFGRTEPTLVYNHAPYEMLILAPLTYLPYPVAFLVWNLLNLAFLAWSLYLLKPYASNLDTASRVLLTLLVLYPLVSTLREGQDSIPLLLAFCLAFVSLKQDNQFAAGCALAAGLFRFQLVLPFLLVFLVRKRWRVVLGALTVGVGLGLLSLALVGWIGARVYAESLLAVTHQGRHYVPTLGMPNIRGFLDTVFANRVGRWYLTGVVAASSLALLGWVIRKWGESDWDPVQRRFDLLFSLNLIVTFLVAYHSFMHNLIVLTLPMLLLLDYCRAGGRGALSRRRPILSLILLFSMTLFLNLAGGNRFNYLAVPLLLLAFAVAGEVTHSQPRAGVPEAARQWLVPSG
jgi:hypothetical protein